MPLLARNTSSFQVSLVIGMSVIAVALRLVTSRFSAVFRRRLYVSLFLCLYLSVYSSKAEAINCQAACHASN